MRPRDLCFQPRSPEADHPSWAPAGTPLNNNIRELFNLMNFIDPANWNNLDELTREYESVNSDNLTALRERLKP